MDELTVTPTTGEATQNAREIVPTQSTPNFAALVAASEKLNDMEVILTLTAEYIEMEVVGEKVRGIYIGEGTMIVTDKETGHQQTLPIVRFLMDKQVKIHAGAVLVNEIRKHAVPVGQPVEIEYTGKSGKTKLFNVSLLGNR